MGTVKALMERVDIDIMGPLNETERKNPYILMMLDYLTKGVEVFPLPVKRAVTVAQVLASEWVCCHGALQTVHSDQGGILNPRSQKMCTLFATNTPYTFQTTTGWPGGNFQCHSAEDFGHNS